MGSSLVHRAFITVFYFAFTFLQPFPLRKGSFMVRSHLPQTPAPKGDICQQAKGRGEVSGTVKGARSPPAVSPSPAHAPTQ